jgi:hypothetical protein
MIQQIEPQLAFKIQGTSKFVPLCIKNIGYVPLQMSHFKDIPLLFMTLKVCHYSFTSVHSSMHLIEFVVKTVFVSFVRLSGPSTLQTL